MAGPPVFSGISFQPSDSTEGCMRVCHGCFYIFMSTSVHLHEEFCTSVCVSPYTCANLNGVCLCVGYGQLPCVQRGEVVSDTTGAVLLPQPGGCVHSEVNGSLLGILPALSDAHGKKRHMCMEAWRGHTELSP